MITQKISLDLQQEQRRRILPAKQGDALQRQVEITLFSGGSAWNVPDTLPIRKVIFCKPDGHGGIYDTMPAEEYSATKEYQVGDFCYHIESETEKYYTCNMAIGPGGEAWNPEHWTAGGDPAVTVENNVATVKMAPEVFTCAGLVAVELQMMSEDGAQITSWTWLYQVAESVEGGIKSKDYWNVQSLIQIIGNYVDTYMGKKFTNIGNALLNLFAYVAYTDENGQEYYDDLQAALIAANPVASIEADFNQGANVIYDTDSLDVLRQYLTVTVIYEDGTRKVKTVYTLSGTLTAGTSTITVSYGGKTATFTATVTAVLYNLENQTIGASEPDDYFLTGINVLQADFACTIFLDITTTSNPTSGSNVNAVWKMIFEWSAGTSGRGIALGKQNGTDARVSFWWMSTATADYYTLNDLSPSAGRFRFAVTHAANSGLVTLKYKKNSGEVVTFESTRTFVPETTEGNQLSFGTSGNHGLPAGTIHLARIYGDVLSDDRITDFFEGGG